MTQTNDKAKRVLKYKKFSEDMQKKIVQEIQDGLISKRAAQKKYRFCHRTLYNWINKHSLRRLALEDYKYTNPGMQETESNNILVSKVKDLEKALNRANLKVAALQTIIEVAENDLKIKIRKKAGSRQ
jgi:transposase